MLQSCLYPSIAITYRYGSRQMMPLLTKRPAYHRDKKILHTVLTSATHKLTPADRIHSGPGFFPSFVFTHVSGIAKEAANSKPQMSEKRDAIPFSDPWTVMQDRRTVVPRASNFNPFLSSYTNILTGHLTPLPPNIAQQSEPGCSYYVLTHLLDYLLLYLQYISTYARPFRVYTLWT